jgi:hypothetical protein
MSAMWAVTAWIHVLVGQRWAATVQHQMQMALVKVEQIVGKQQLLKNNKNITIVIGGSSFSCRCSCFFVLCLR